MPLASAPCPRKTRPHQAGRHGTPNLLAAEGARRIFCSAIREGRAAPSNRVCDFDLIALAQKGSLYVTRPTLANYIATREELVARSGAVFGMIAAGKLKLRIEYTYPLADVQRAHRDLEGRKTTGKLLLIP